MSKKRRPPPPPPAEDPELSPEERRLFLDSVRDLGAVPAAPSAAAVPEPPAAGEVAEIPEDESELFLRAMQALEKPPVKDAPAGREPDSGLRRLRPAKSRGLRPEDRLDLHGKRVAEALRRLESFVEAAVRRRLRYVVVITGKGLHSEGGAVLRREVEQWIQRRGKRRIEAYSEAPREIGGRGAFVLHLRPPR